MLPPPHARRRALKLCSLVAICGLGPIGLTACGGSSSSTNATASGAAATTTAPTKIVTAWPADVTTLDPANLSTDQDHTLSRNIYQTLALPVLVPQKDGTLRPSGTKVTPYLAKSWDIGKTSITYHLRDGVRFYPSGDPLTAADVKFSLDRIFDTPGAGDLQSNGLQGPQDIQVVDAHTVRLDFTSKDGKPTPVTAILQFEFGQHFTGIVDSKVAEQHVTPSDKYAAKWLRLNAVGSGPYYIAARTPGEGLTLKAIPNNWTPAPNFTEVDVRVTSGSIASLLQTGDVNYADSGMTSKQADDLAKAGRSVFWQTTGNFDMFAITAAPTADVGPLGNKLVRQAMGYALPYDEVLKSVIYGRGERSGSLVQPTAPEYTPAWLVYKTDLAKAKQLMAAAGNPTVNAPLHYLQGDEDQTNTAILVQANLKKIGVQTTLTPETQAGLFDVVNARSQPEKGKQIGPAGLELFDWSGFADDPSIVLGYWATTGGINNYALYSSPTVDAINKKFAFQGPSAARTAAYQKAQQTIAADAPYIPIVNVGAITVVTKGIEGVSFSPGGSGRYWTLHPAGVPNPIVSSLFG
ncbi:MAG: peptide/nickel transport system substrate-binding protein [Pseudonocardiales bacterium]|nr:peptide/nickel transport system substrate-binding protein [Pseudonocardiales bacterium]